jgi:hypothetical protein
VQNRGGLLSRDACHPQFKPLFPLARFATARARGGDPIFPDLMLFGEWCYAVHTVPYTKLPDWFLAFDIYDRARSEFWSVARRDALVQRLALTLVPRVGTGTYDLPGLRRLLGQSRLADGPAEGLYVRCDEGDRLAARCSWCVPSLPSP